jgi:hypothetical protein
MRHGGALPHEGGLLAWRFLWNGGRYGKLAGRVLAAALILVFGLVGSAGAHFGMVIPSDNMVMQADDRTIALNLSFSHPMEMVGMPLVKPKAFTVQANGEAQDLIPMLQATAGDGASRLESRLPDQAARGLHVCHGAAAILGTG